MLLQKKIFKKFSNNGRGYRHSKQVMHSFSSKILFAQYEFLGSCQARGFKSKLRRDWSGISYSAVKCISFSGT